MKFISLGSSCGTTTFLQRANLKGPNYPFDWALSPPQFTLEIIKRILNGNTRDFFKGRYGHDGVTYVPAELGSIANTDFRTIFPHEDHKTRDEVYDTYYRRIDRLRDALLSDDPVTYIWSPPGGTPTFEKEPIIQDIREPLNDIYHIVQKYNPKSRVFVFHDTDIEFTSGIQSYRIKPSDNYGGIASQISETTNNGQVLS
jgi:hypothetical protein